jgi:hypothetical protein
MVMQMLVDECRRSDVVLQDRLVWKNNARQMCIYLFGIGLFSDGFQAGWKRQRLHYNSIVCILPYISAAIWHPKPSLAHVPPLATVDLARVTGIVTLETKEDRESDDLHFTSIQSHVFS